MNEELRSKVAMYASRAPKVYKEQIIIEMEASLKQHGVGMHTSREVILSYVSLIPKGELKYFKKFETLFEKPLLTLEEKSALFLGMCKSSNIIEALKFVETRNLEDRIAATIALYQFERYDDITGKRLENLGTPEVDDAARDFLTETTIEYLLEESPQLPWKELSNKPKVAYLLTCIGAIMRTVGEDPKLTTPEQLKANLKFMKSLQ